MIEFAGSHLTTTLGLMKLYCDSKGFCFIVVTLPLTDSCKCVGATCILRLWLGLLKVQKSGFNVKGRQSCCYGNRCQINMDEDRVMKFGMWSGNYDIFQI